MDERRRLVEIAALVLAQSMDEQSCCLRPRRLQYPPRLTRPRDLAPLRASR